MNIFDKCSIEDCTNKPERIIKALDSGYCMEHWKDISGNLKHFPVLKLYKCPYCRWVFSRHFVLQNHIDEKHKEM